MKGGTKVRVRTSKDRDAFDAHIIFPPKVGKSLFLVRAKDDEIIQTSTLKRWYKWDDANFGYHTLNTYYHMEIVE